MEGQFYIQTSRMFEIISHGDRLIVTYPINYWALISKGMSEQEASKRLDV
jgi:hypothetical protein